jgi:GMP synthase (glutamine-hydrolysing)
MVRHSPTVPAGHLAGVLHASGHAVHRVDLFDGGEVPASTDWSGVVSLGGLMGAYEENRYPWLRDEKRLLAAATDAGVPVLGLCLGCQLLADALGGAAFPAEVPELGMLRVELTEAGRDDAVLRHLTERVPAWHGDTWDLPPGGELLASTDRHPHAFRVGGSIGIQAHPEATPYMVARWIADHQGDDLVRTGTDAAEFLAAVRSGAVAQREMALHLFRAWLEEVDAK